MTTIELFGEASLEDIVTTWTIIPIVMITSVRSGAGRRGGAACSYITLNVVRVQL